MNLDKMTITELRELEKKVNHKINEVGTNEEIFLNDLQELYHLKIKKNLVDEEISNFSEKSFTINGIEKLGYKIIEHSNCYSILDFNRKKINNEYVGFRYSKKEGLTNSWRKILDEDYEKINKLIKG